jgi:hypothetical protein
MKYVVDMGSDVMTYIPGLIQSGSGIQMLMRWKGFADTHRQHGDLISLLLFFQNEESRLKREEVLINFNKTATI